MKNNADKIRSAAWRVFAGCFVVAFLFFLIFLSGDDYGIGLAFMFISGVIALLSLNAVIACEFLEVANNKGYYSIKYFWYCFLFGIVGWLLVIALPDMSNRAMMNKMLNAINKEDK